MKMNLRYPILYAFAAAVALFLIAPLGIVVSMSFSAGGTLSFPPPGYGTRWYETVFESGAWRRAAWSSLRVGLASGLLAMVLGTLGSLGLVRGRYPFKGLINALMLSPLIVPLVVTAVGTYLFFVDLGLTGSFAGLVLAHTALGVPFVIITVSASLRTIDRNLELAAANLGASPRRAFRHITLPLIAPGVGIGGLFAFIWSWDELVVALFLTSPITRTLPVQMWGQVRSRVDPSLAAVATLLIGVTILFLSIVLLTRRLSKVRA